MQKDTDFSGYIVTCFGCKSRENLMMIAHRDDDNNVCGWLFSCTKCAIKFFDKKVKIEVL